MEGRVLCQGAFLLIFEMSFEAVGELKEEIINAIPDSRKDGVLLKSIDAVANNGDPEAFNDVIQSIMVKFSFVDESVNKNAFNTILSVDKQILQPYRCTDAIYHKAYASMEELLQSLEPDN